jgi:DNA polymerase (family 10)
VVARLRKVAGVEEVSIAGSLRRMQETIGDIDILVAAVNGAEVIEQFTRFPGVADVLAAGETKGSVRLDDGLQIDMRVVTPESWGAALQYFTGSKAHNVRLRSLAGSEGMKINEYGVFKGDERVAGRTEAECYAALGLDWIPPEMREDRNEIEAATTHALPEIITLDDMRGDLQMHTTHSDGGDSLEAMAQAAQELGYEYILITDHSQSLRVGHGLDVEALATLHTEIDELNQTLKGFRVLAGTEVDILADGELDYPDEVLGELDIVLASFHSHFDLAPDRMTRRLIRAIENPHVKIIGHPTGRRLGYRESSPMDLERVIKAAVANNVALEINAHYERLDLGDIHARMAAELGAKIVISTDAHSTTGLQMMRFGVAVARRAWLTPEQVINTWSLESLLGWCQNGRVAG